jgi:hypothetical protein
VSAQQLFIFVAFDYYLHIKNRDDEDTSLYSFRVCFEKIKIHSKVPFISDKFYEDPSSTFLFYPYTLIKRKLMALCLWE